MKKRVQLRQGDISDKAYKWYCGTDEEVTVKDDVYFLGGEKIGYLQDLDDAFCQYVDDAITENPEDFSDEEILRIAEMEDFWTDTASAELFRRAGIDGSDASTFAEIEKNTVDVDELFELAKKRLGLIAVDPDNLTDEEILEANWKSGR